MRPGITSRPVKYIIAGARRELSSRAEKKKRISPGACITQRRPYEPFARAVLHRDAASYPIRRRRMDAGTSRKGVAAPRGGNGRVMIYLAFGLENDFLRYRIAAVRHEEDASPGFSGYRGRAPAASVERRTVATRASSW